MKNPILIKKAVKKAITSDCRFKVSALGFNAKGDFIGSKTNIRRFECKGGGLHAEINLIHEYGAKVRTIVICRVSKSGNLLPIDPCPNCQKVADKLGIKILSIGTD
ncbi:MAG: hypothetical protein ACOC2U_02730 [bacterium]